MFKHAQEKPRNGFIVVTMNYGIKYHVLLWIFKKKNSLDL
jgi:hypothetical protein